MALLTFIWPRAGREFHFNRRVSIFQQTSRATCAWVIFKTPPSSEIYFLTVKKPFFTTPPRIRDSSTFAWCVHAISRCVYPTIPFPVLIFVLTFTFFSPNSLFALPCLRVASLRSEFSIFKKFIASTNFPNFRPQYLNNRLELDHHTCGRKTSLRAIAPP